MSNVSQIFKSYDIRGEYPIINGNVGYLVARSFVQDILIAQGIAPRVVVMMDCRVSSPEIYSHVIQGLVDGGGDVIQLGEGTTDLMYAGCMAFDCAGIMVTASHNPKSDNGMKIVKRIPEILGLDAGLATVRDRVLVELDSLGEVGCAEPVLNEDALSQTWQLMTDTADTIGRIETTDASFKQQAATIVVDSGNGMGSIMAHKLKAWYPSIKWVLMYCEPDGTYPNHPADPSKKENMEDLVAEVKRQNAILGIAFDGDADRAYFVDESGEIVDSNYIASILGQFFVTMCMKDKMEFTPGVVYSLPQSRSVPYAALEVSGLAIPCKQGHTNMKAIMSKYNCIYGGEGTGHHYFGQFGYMDSGILTVCAMLRILSERQVHISSLVGEFKSVYHLSGEHNFRLPEGVTFDDLQAKLMNHYMDGMPNFLDGISIFYSDWKLNLRSSNTEPVVRLNVESIGGNMVDDKLAEVQEVLGL